MTVETPLNYYGLPITSPEYFDGLHVANPGPAGLPPVCSCGWTPWGQFTMADHLRDMGEFAVCKPSEGATRGSDE